MVVIRKFLDSLSLERCLNNWQNTKIESTFFENANFFNADGGFVYDHTKEVYNLLGNSFGETFFLSFHSAS